MSRVNMGWVLPTAISGRIVVVSMLLAACWSGPGNVAQAQLAGGAINGIVTDPSGAAVPNATVAAIDEQTGVRTQVVTDNRGFYVIQPLIGGQYRVEVQAHGFQEFVRTGLQVRADQRLEVDAALVVGASTQVVQISGQQPLIDTATSNPESVVSLDEMFKLPTIEGSRTAVTLAQYTDAAFQNNSYAGSKDNDVAMYYDGAGVNNRLGPHTFEIEPRGETTTEEFSVQTGSYSAQYHGSMVENTTTRSGTNSFHGEAYYYLQSSALNATPWGCVPPSCGSSHTNDPGFSIGGPIRKDKTFFYVDLHDQFGSYAGNYGFLPIPTPAERTGDFSNLLDSSGNLVPIYDPATAAPCPGNPAQICRTQFPGNIIPTNRIDTVAANILGALPLPNVAGASPSANFTAPQTQALTEDIWPLVRVDHVFNDNNRVFFRWVQEHWALNQSREDGPIETGPGQNGILIPPANNRMITAGWTHTFNPDFVSQIYFSSRLQSQNNVSPTYNQGGAESVGLLGTLDPKATFPQVNFLPYPHLGPPFAVADGFGSPAYLVAQNYSWVHGRHNLKFGADIQYSKDNSFDRNFPSGQLFFDANGTDAGTEGGGGNAFASFLLGFVSSADLSDAPKGNTINNPIGAHTWYLAPWIQDDWLVRPNFTLNVGLRWEIDTDVNLYPTGQLSGFNATTINPVSGTPGVVTFSGDGTWGDSVHNTQFSHLSPRVGFAWQPWGASSKTVLRGGWGLIFSAPGVGGACSACGSGYLSTDGPRVDVAPAASFTASSNFITPAFYLQNGFPAYQALAPETPGFGAVAVGQAPIFSPTYLDPNRKVGYSHEMSFDVEHQLPWATVVSLGYLGTFGRDWDITIPLNQLNPTNFGPGNAQILLPFPQFGSVSTVAADGRQNYNAMEFRVIKRFSRGLQAKVDWVWSHNMDDFSWYRSYWEPELNYAPSSLDQRHRVSISGSYDFPLGPKQQYVQNGPLSRVLGGWTIGWIYNWYDGMPVQIVNPSNTCNCFAPQGVDQVSSTANSHSSTSVPVTWFNPNAFAAPAAYTFGDAQGGGLIYGPPSWELDADMRKSIAVRESYSVTARFDATNIFNHPNLGTPNVTLGTPGFGEIFGKTDTRAIQLGIDIRF